MLAKLRNSGLFQDNTNRTCRGVIKQDNVSIEVFGDLNDAFASTARNFNFFEDRDTVFPLYVNGSMITLNVGDGYDHKYIITPLPNLDVPAVLDKLKIRELPEELIRLSLGNFRGLSNYKRAIDEKALLTASDPNVGLLIKLAYLTGQEKGTSLVEELYSEVVSSVEDYFIDSLVPLKNEIHVISYSPWFVYVVSNNPSLTIEGFQVKEVTESSDCFNWYISVLRDFL